jgi:hypothetical protein
MHPADPGEAARVYELGGETGFAPAPYRLAGIE